MPTETTSKWPKPKSEDEFEDIVLDALKIRWGDPNATRNGRRGQRQNGVDIFGKARHLDGGVSGAQCKNTLNPTLEMVVDEVAKAITFQPSLSEYLFVTAADRDVRLQEQVRLHYAKNPARFPVRVLFWDDLVHDMAGHPRLFKKHWPTIASPGEVVATPEGQDHDGMRAEPEPGLRSSPSSRSLEVDVRGGIYQERDLFVALVASISNQSPPNTIREVSVRVGDRTYWAAEGPPSKSIDGYPWFRPRDMRLEENDSRTGAWYFGPSFDGGEAIQVTPPVAAVLAVTPVRGETLEFEIDILPDDDGEAEEPSSSSSEDSGLIPETAPSTASVCRGRDLQTLRRTFAFLPHHALTNWLERAGYCYLDHDMFYFWEDLNARCTAAGFHIYDESLGKKMETFHTAWRDLLSHGEWFQMGVLGTTYLLGRDWQTMGDRDLENRQTTIEREADAALEAFKHLVKHVRIEYPEVDLDDLETMAFAWLRDFKKRLDQ